MLAEKNVYLYFNVIITYSLKQLKHQTKEKGSQILFIRIFWLIFWHFTTSTRETFSFFLLSFFFGGGGGIHVLVAETLNT